MPSARPSRRFAVLLVLVVSALAVLVPAASAHGGRDHHDGRLPGQPDFKRIGNTTYRFKPGLGEYEIRTPGEPVATAHVDYKSEEGVYAGPNTPLPTQELAPICRTSGNRIVIVYSHRSSDTTPTPTETIRAVVRRMNWKINQQGSLSSGGGRTVKMAVDCTSGGDIQVHDMTTTNNDLSTISSAAKSLLGNPSGTDAVKYLVFDHEENGAGTGISERRKDASKSFTNQNATLTSVSIAYSGIWTTHVPMHELFHGLGSSQGDSDPPAPYSTVGSHCIDGIDVLCYAEPKAESSFGKFTETSCPASEGYDQAEKTPLDCNYDTYFNTAPASGTWLAKYWNTGGEEDPYLVNSSDPLLMVDGESASAIKDESARLQGTVYARGSLETNYRFEYGITTSYGSSLPNPSAGVAATVTGKKIEATPSSLTPGTTYHYRLVVTNSNGTVYGPDRTFKTSIWTIKATPASAESRQLLDVSCTERNACTGVGISDSATLVERWDGSEWARQTTPTIGGATSGELRSVSCSGSSFCMAVGSSREETYGYPDSVADYWNGSSWSVTSVPSPAYASGVELYGVSCISANSCVAVGQYGIVGEGEEAEEETRGFIASWDGSKWMAIPVPEPKGTVESTLHGVSCVFANACVAVGRARNGSGVNATLAERWNGETWSVQETPTLTGADNRLEDVSCGSPAFCMATGIKNGNAPLFERWDGSSWTEKPASDVSLPLPSVSCLPSGECVAAGSGLPMAASWNGTTWSSMGMNPPTGSETAVLGVSCWAPESCVGVGRYLDDGRYVALAEHHHPFLPPAATTTAATGVAATIGVLNATLNPEGYETKYQFEYGLTAAYGATMPASPKGIGGGTNNVQVSGSIAELKPVTTYHFRVVAQNAAGKTAGKDLTFVTAPAPPIAETGLATGVERLGATLRGTINPQGSATKYQFEYGTTNSYGHSIPIPAEAVGSGGSGVAVSKSISGLLPETSYHYRVVATNEAGTSKGEDIEFISLGGPAEPIFGFGFGEAGVGDGQFQFPGGVAVDGEGSILVGDVQSHRVQKFNSEGEYLTQFGSYGSGPGQFAYPTGVAVDSMGDIWVADANNNRVQKFNSEGEYLTQIGSYGTAVGHLMSPMGIAVDASGNIWVADYNNNRIQEFDAEGEYIQAIASSGGTVFYHPIDIDIDAEGDIWVTDGTSRVVQLSAEGGLLGKFGSYGEAKGQFTSIGGLALDAEGNVWVADAGGNRIQGFNAEGEFILAFGEPGSGEGQFSLAPGPTLAIDQKGAIWVADTHNTRIQMWAPGE